MKKHLLLLINCLLLCCTVTFAWILSGDPEIVESVRLDYTGDNQMIISSVNADIQVVFGEEETSGEDFELTSEPLLPGAMIPFRITIDYQSQNPEKTALTVSLSMVGIRVSDERLLKYMFISVSPKSQGLINMNGYNNIYMSCANAQPMAEEGMYVLEIYGGSNSLIIPHNDAPEEGGAISELEGFLYFSSKADASLQDVTFDFVAFRVE